MAPLLILLPDNAGYLFLLVSGTEATGWLHYRLQAGKWPLCQPLWMKQLLNR